MDDNLKKIKPMLNLALPVIFLLIILLLDYYLKSICNFPYSNQITTGIVILALNIFFAEKEKLFAPLILLLGLLISITLFTESIKEVFASIVQKENFDFSNAALYIAATMILFSLYIAISPIGEIKARKEDKLIAEIASAISLAAPAAGAIIVATKLISTEFDHVIIEPKAGILLLYAYMFTLLCKTISVIIKIRIAYQEMTKSKESTDSITTTDPQEYNTKQREAAIAGLLDHYRKKSHLTHYECIYLAVCELYIKEKNEKFNK